uniref:Uncharacterized protein n=1 Tax=Anguilla anguilla TaxID=7936 RepID=A0A0E9QXG8_ANGAN
MLITSALCNVLRQQSQSKVHFEGLVHKTRQIHLPERINKLDGLENDLY